MSKFGVRLEKPLFKTNVSLRMSYSIRFRPSGTATAVIEATAAVFPRSEPSASDSARSEREDQGGRCFRRSDGRIQSPDAAGFDELIGLLSADFLRLQG